MLKEVFPAGAPPPQTLPTSASGAPADPFHRQVRRLREKRCGAHPPHSFGDQFGSFSWARAVQAPNR
eukprot:12564353-Alexandrium_andersonii.AAC.1